MIFLSQSLSKEVKNLNRKYIFSMVSKTQIKLITSLHQKKFRQANNLFIAEGVKVINELLNSNFELEHIYETENLFVSISMNKRTLISSQDLKKISALTVPNNCLAVFKIPLSLPVQEGGLILALDDVRDP